ncbi:hypothetical protein [Nocardiopsis aegyptia]|uniref:Uncharacterized protein n=1 Tax=Nocardiopsis aegyptia TaxID=220378 RepID=A0A7Z0ETD1_9ACTN|nr:hypothetical protein [Nocardiopsis aegyptia]NYJ37431.1 hypothetical protein [Nocardiopsis aegyptia]
MTVVLVAVGAASAGGLTGSGRATSGGSAGSAGAAVGTNRLHALRILFLDSLFDGAKVQVESPTGG